jgi:hypothetical protein
MPAHTHTVNEGTIYGGSGTLTSGDDYTNTVAFIQTSSSTGSGGSHTHPLTQGIKYYDFIIAAKD